MFVLTNLTDGKLINDSRSDEHPNIPMLSFGIIFWNNIGKWSNFLSFSV